MDHGDCLVAPLPFHLLHTIEHRLFNVGKNVSSISTSLFNEVRAHFKLECGRQVQDLEITQYDILSYILSSTADYSYVADSLNIIVITLTSFWSLAAIIVIIFVILELDCHLPM